MLDTARVARATLPVSLLLFLLLGCSDAPQELSETTVYRHVFDGHPGSLDPAHAGNLYASMLVVNLYDTLYRYKYLAQPAELAPNLAAALPEVSDDGLVYTIRLRDDARFVDDPAFSDGVGRPVIAEDVVYSLKRHFHPETRSQGAWLWRERIVGLEAWAAAGADWTAPVPGLRAIDDQTVLIKLKEPYPQLPFTLAMALSAVVPREAVEHYGRAFGVNPVGSGPFRLARLDEFRAVLRPHPQFRRGTLDLAREGYSRSRHASFGLEALDGMEYPFVDRLEVHFIAEPTARWSSFRAGEVDTVMVPPEQAPRMLESLDPIEFTSEIETQYHTLAEPESGFVFYGFNMANPEIGQHPDPERDQRNRALRCSIRDAFDWEGRNETFYRGLARVFPGVIPPFLAEFDSGLSTASIEYRPEIAKQRLAEHGWYDSAFPVLAYGMEASVTRRQMFEHFRALLSRVGIPTEALQSKSFASFGEVARAINNRQLDLFLFSWIMAYPDAQYSLQLFYGPNAAPGANSFNYSNPEFDRVFEAATQMPQGPARTALYRQLNEMVIDDCVIIGSLMRTRLHLWRRNVLMVPNREIGAGYFLRFVGIETATP